MESKLIKILAIDDNLDNLITIQALIKEAFPLVEIYTALSGEEGLKLATEKDPDVILLDIIMPDMDGFAVCEKLKADKLLSNIPIVFVTAIKGDTESRIKALESGAEAFITKPIDQSELVAQIRAMVKIKNANIERRDENVRLAKLVEDRTSELKKTHTATLNLLEDLKKENEARKKTEEALHKSEELYRSVINASPDNITVTDLNGNILMISPKGCELIGLDSDQILYRNINEFLVEGDRERAKTNIMSMFQGIFNGPEEYKIINVDGNAVDTEINAEFVRDIKGSPTGLVFAIRDVTERKIAQDAIRQSENKYRLITEKISDVVWLMDLEGKSTFVSKSVENFTGFTVEEYLNQSISDRFEPESAHLAVSTLHDDIVLLSKSKSKIKDYKKILTLNYKCKDGNIKTGEVLVTPYIDENNKLIGVHGVTRDITERKISEEKLTYVTRLYAFLSQINQVIVRTKTADDLLDTICKLAIQFGQFRMCWVGVYDENEGIIRPTHVAGHDDGYLDGLNIRPDDELSGSGPTGRAFHEQKMFFCNDVANDALMSVWKDEALERGYRSSFAAPLFSKGKPYGTFTLYANEINFFDDEEQKLISEITEDISFALDAIDLELDRNIAEEALIESEAKYREFVENSPEAIAIYVDGIVTYVNKECLKLMRATTKDELIGMSVIDFIHPDNRQLVIDRMQQVAISETDVSLPAVEEKYIRLDGTPIFVEVKVMPMIVDNKPAVQLTARDITDRKAVEKALERSRIELKTIYDHAPVMMCVVDENRKILFANNAFSSLTGVAEDIMKGGAVGGVIGCINSLDNPRGCGHGINCKKCTLRSAMENTFQTGVGKKNVEYQSTLNIAGEMKEVSLLGSTALIQTADHNSLLLCLHDITDRKLAEEALQKSEMLLRTFIDNTPFEIWARDNDGVGILENKKLVEHYGSIIGQTPKSDNRINEETAEYWLMINSRVLAGEVIDEEYEFIVHGENRMYQQIVFPIMSNAKIIGIAGFNIDITDRKIAEEALRQNNSRLELAMKVANMAWWEMDVKTGDVLFGKKKTDMLGYLPGNFKHFGDFMNIVHPEDHDIAMSAMKNHLYNNADKYETEYRIKTSSGDYKWFYDLGNISKIDSNGNPLKISGIVLDITARKTAEKELTDQKRFFEQMFMQSSLSTQILDNNGWCERINPKLTQLFGVEAKDIEGKVYNIFNDEEIIKKGIVPKLEKVFKKGKMVEWEILFDIGIASEAQDIKVAEKKKAWFSNWAYPIFDENKKITHVIIQHNDITDRKQAQEALTESQEQLKKFAAHLQNVREEERVLLAREIHDELGQILVAVKIDMGMLKQSVLKVIDNDHSVEMQEKFTSLSGLVDNTIRTARKIMTDLRPEVLDLLGFSDAVKQHLRTFEERYKVLCIFENKTTNLELNLQQSVALFRIIQEAMNNVAKHAKATEVNITINQVQDNLTLEIKDNGIGFDEKHKKNNDSYGLIGMKERVFLLDGELTVTGIKDKGTTIIIKMPYRR